MLPVNICFNDYRHFWAPSPHLAPTDQATDGRAVASEVLGDAVHGAVCFVEPHRFIALVGRHVLGHGQYGGAGIDGVDFIC